MSTKLTANEIQRTGVLSSDGFSIEGRNYSTLPYQALSFSKFVPQTNCIGHNGIVYTTYIENYPDDDITTFDYYILDDLVDTVFSFRMDVAANVYNYNTFNIVGRCYGIQWCTARWDSAGTLSLTNRTIVLQTYVSGTTTRWTLANNDGLTRASCIVTDGNSLVIRQRKANFAHGDTYGSFVTSHIIGTSTRERGAFISAGPTGSETTAGHHNGYN